MTSQAHNRGRRRLRRGAISANRGLPNSTATLANELLCNNVHELTCPHLSSIREIQTSSDNLYGGRNRCWKHKRQQQSKKRQETISGRYWFSGSTMLASFDTSKQQQIKSRHNRYSGGTMLGLYAFIRVARIRPRSTQAGGNSMVISECDLVGVARCWPRPTNICSIYACIRVARTNKAKSDAST